MMNTLEIIASCDLENVFSSPEPSGSQGELLVYLCSGARHCRPSVVYSVQTSSPLKLGQSKPNFMWNLLGTGEQRFI